MTLSPKTGIIVRSIFSRKKGESHVPAIPGLWDMPLFSLIGFGFAALLGLWLTFLILRSGKY